MIYDNELWVDVINHESDYMISTYGRLLNKHTGKIKYPVDLNSSGYPRHTMYYGKPDRQLVHRMVAIHFIPNIFNYPVVNHIDCNKLNCHVSNLEWTTYKENTNHYLNNLDLVERNKNNTSYDNLIRKNIKPVIAIYNDNSRYLYESITQAANYNDTDRVYIQRNLGKYIERFQCTYLLQPAMICPAYIVR